MRLQITPVLLRSLPKPHSSLGSFSINDGDGSENVSFEMNSRFLNLCRDYSISLKTSDAGKFPWRWFLGDRTQV